MVSTERLVAIHKMVEEYGLEKTAQILDVSEQSVKRYERELVSRSSERATEVDFGAVSPMHRNEVVGVIGDTHLPYEHPYYLDFVYDTFEEYKVTKVVHIGDLVDNHYISRHQTETDAYSPIEEQEKARERVARWAEAFPEVTMLLGNHDKIPARQIASLGIPEVYLKSFSNLWGLPDSWVVQEDLMWNDVYFFHGTGSTGKTPAFNRALNNRLSTVQGHAHSAFGCMYHANQKDIVFGLDVGCGIDNEAYAFRYGKPFPKKPILGCGIVYSSTQAIAVPMGAKYFR